MKRSDFLLWNEDTKAVVRPGLVQLNRFVNSITVLNSGTVNVLVNNDLLYPGVWKSFGGEPRSVYDGTIEIKWIEQTPAPVPAIEMVTVTQIYYVDKDPS
jgi:hypothetical protein